MRLFLFLALIGGYGCAVKAKCKDGREISFRTTNEDAGQIANAVKNYCGDSQ